MQLNHLMFMDIINTKKRRNSTHKVLLSGKGSVWLHYQ